MEDKSDCSCVAPYILLSDNTLIGVCNEIEDALVRGDPELLQHNGQLYWKSSGGLVKVDATLLRIRAMKIVSFAKRARRTGRLEFVDPPLKYFHALLRMRGWRFAHIASNEM